MYLVIGLGNPGTQYEKTRHNVGFQVVDAFLQKNLSSSSFTFDKKANALVLQETWRDNQLVFVKPQTFMNKSGLAAKVLWQKYYIRDWVTTPRATQQFAEKHFQNVRGIFVNPFAKNSTQLSSFWQNKRNQRKLIVIQDDIDLPIGKIKISLGSSSGGHKGVESIINAIGTKDFARIRVGIQPEYGKPTPVEDFVLQPFGSEEKTVIETVVLNAQHALEMLITEGIEKARNQYN